MQTNSVVEMDVTSCPMCGGNLVLTSETYSSTDIFDLWISIGIPFSDQVRHAPNVKSQVQLHECIRCGFGIFLPLWAGDAAFYDELSHTAGYYLANRWEFEVALRDLRTTSHVLEIGCGSGNFLAQLDALGKRTLGLELSADAVAMSKAKGLNVQARPLEEIASIAAGEFEAVCAFQVLEHVENPAQFLRDAIRCLKPGGQLILAVPNAGGILKYMHPSPSDAPPHHVTRWKAETFRQLSSYGVRVVHIKYERLDAARFHWLLRWWDHLWGKDWSQEREYSRQQKLRSPIWIMGRIALHHSLYFLRRSKLPWLPLIHGHSLYVLLEKR